MDASRQLLEELKARQDIHDVLVRFCRGADRCDEALMLSCFHEDAWDDHGSFNGPASEFCSRTAARLREGFVSTKHFMTNEYVEIEGDTAKSEASILAFFRLTRDGKPFEMTVFARYLDHFERRGGQWKILHRLLISDGTRVDPVAEEAPQFNRGKPGARVGEDPSDGYFRSP